MFADHHGERVSVLHAGWRGRQRGQLVTEVSYQLRDTPTVSMAIADAAAHLTPRRLGSPMPSGMHAAANPESWARSKRSGLKPEPVMLDSSRRP